MPTSTNLALVTPASTDYVTNGATAMTTLANGIDAYFGTTTTYTPTFTNVTGVAAVGRFIRMGKLGILSIGISAGTATAAGIVTATLPTGWTAAGVLQAVPGLLNAAVISVRVPSSGTTVEIRADAAGNNFALGAALSGVRLNGWVLLA